MSNTRPKIELVRSVAGPETAARIDDAWTRATVDAAPGAGVEPVPLTLSGLFETPGGPPRVAAERGHLYAGLPGRLHGDRVDVFVTQDRPGRPGAAVVLGDGMTANLASMRARVDGRPWGDAASVLGTGRPARRPWTQAEFGAALGRDAAVASTFRPGALDALTSLASDLSDSRRHDRSIHLRVTREDLAGRGPIGALLAAHPEAVAQPAHDASGTPVGVRRGREGIASLLEGFGRNNAQRTLVLDPGALLDAGARDGGAAAPSVAAALRVALGASRSNEIEADSRARSLPRPAPALAPARHREAARAR
jgi:hypothetical protein